MLKSLFEASIDKLNIPAEMKTAIKDINNICLEAEDDKDKKAKKDDKDKKDDKGYTPKDKEDDDKGYTPRSKEDKGYTPMSDEDRERGKQLIEDEKIGTNVDDAKDEDHAWKIISNLQKRAKQNRGTPEGEKWRKKLETEYNKALEANLVPHSKGIEMTISNKGNQQPVTPEQKQAINERWNYQSQPQQSQPMVFKDNQQPQQSQPMVFKNNQQSQKPQQQAAPAAQNTEQQTQQPQASNDTTKEQSQAPAPQGQQQAQPQQQAPQQQQNQQPQAQNAAQPQKQAQFRKGADVATVQYFLNSRNPNLKLATDGVLGPNTIKAIQATENINATGKMDNDTKEAFNLLLNEAKKKVQAAQGQLGVSQDGLIGKQTLAALQKANMQVASIFSGNLQAPANAQPAQQQGAQPQQQAQNVTSKKFNEAQAQKFLKNNIISQQEYNNWKQYGIAPVFQRQNPQGTQNQIAAMQQKQKEVNTGTNVQKGGQQTVLTTNGPRNEAEKKFFDQTKQNYITIYSADKKTPKSMIVEKADQAAREALAKMQKGEWAKEGQAALNKVINNMGNNNQTQNAAQPQQQAQKGMTREPSQVRTSGAVSQPQQQQQAAQPQQQAQPQQAQQQQQNPKQPQGSTQYLSGKVSYMNLPPDEKKVYDDAEQKAQAEYIKKGNNEQTAYNKAQMNAQVAVLRYRQKKGKKG